ncbi:secretion/DNA translocation related TadE-like protein [Leucobacter exalbidus]|uniref:Secretion/DNA translocation related TadE-like protein n=1 Tax=Leucobacter exalbidus TaxID=662960 RepID=A0A940T4A0_9MICO|nr:M23 family metallopeptidase [Leucobacter exalbidus]MBP1327017.1 secretion/DNA translocation related TadE-like protein [Leucobacter exalbidus]
MSAAALVGCVAAALCIGVPVLAASSHLVTAHRVTGAADAAALAAADALAGWLDGDPCDNAAEVAVSVDATIAQCDIEQASGDVRVVLRVSTPIGEVTARSRAGGVPAAGGGASGTPVSGGPGGGAAAGHWVWPATGRGIAQGFHDGLSIDLNAPLGSALLAPFDGVIVAAGPDGGQIPAVCRATPAWWRGENETVIVRHEYAGHTLFSSHNHIAPGSTRALGLAVGDRVAAGSQVATAGMSGCTSGPHTHFTLSTRPENSFPDLNPFAFLTPP